MNADLKLLDPNGLDDLRYHEVLYSRDSIGHRTTLGNHEDDTVAEVSGAPR